MKSQSIKIIKPSLIASVIVSLLATAPVSFADTPTTPSKDLENVIPEGAPKKPLFGKDHSLFDVFKKHPELSIFHKAMKSSGLEAEMKGKGPFTIFAPKNSAFENLPEGTLQSLMLPENNGKLTTILKNHVHKGNVMAKDIKGKMAVDTAAGTKLDVMEDSGSVKVGPNGTVTESDIETSEGTIHVIDSVILPN